MIVTLRIIFLKNIKRLPLATKKKSLKIFQGLLGPNKKLQLITIHKYNLILNVLCSHNIKCYKIVLCYLKKSDRKLLSYNISKCYCYPKLKLPIVVCIHADINPSKPFHLSGALKVPCYSLKSKMTEDY